MFPLLLLGHIAVSIAAPQCDLDKIAIEGGEYHVIAGVNGGSKVEYSCPEGMYPHPGRSRQCLYNGQWMNEKEKAKCKAVQCPRPLMFENGEFQPRKARYSVGDVLHFECWGGFLMYGPANRTCQANGKWSGEVTRCGDNDGDCPNPGIPIGATKAGSIYEFGEKVSYECQTGLRLLGSRERRCMKSGRWSGAEPACRYWHSYDTPQEVATAFSASISETIESSNPDKVEETNTRKIQVRKDADMNIFIVIDSSKSVGPQNFHTAKEASAVFIEKMASFDFTPRYAVISYASYAKPIVRLSDDDSTDADAVIERIRKFSYREHEDKTGTNTRGALREVYSMLALDLITNHQKFLERKNVILLLTDGKHNMGGLPNLEIMKIRKLLNIQKDSNREDFLDVYVFALGVDINENAINDIASKKDPEKHVFKMESVDHMKEAFDIMLDEEEVLQMCGLSKDPSIGEEGVQEVYPWIARITITRPGSEEKCKGSIVSKSFILTAAHCFHLDDSPQAVNVRVGDKTLKVKNIHRHRKYNPAGKQDKKVEKSFDYDLALIELENKIEYSRKVRPVCLPCTTGTSWALKQRGKAVTCSDHEKTLYGSELVRSMFVAEETRDKFERMDVTIKRGDKRSACLEDTKKIDIYKDIPQITDLISDNFLCTGGTEPQVEPPTCRGDGGGPLLVQFRQRYIQVGVISWGTINSCIGPKRKPEPVPALSRDFHTDLFHMMDWLKEMLREDLEFLN
ncbi:complement factor B-like [Engystomops pustulosus]|uniref:complement factor B-like n=1 Tax=Engystomops pustulosus TaxID=76066 RepID=UPI003AFA6007